MAQVLTERCEGRAATVPVPLKERPAAGAFEEGQLVGEENPEFRAALDAAHPIGRIAEPSEIADAVVWLCSGKSSFVTGIALPVDGGFTAVWLARGSALGVCS
ncbi:SDR family oxidoreductase [Myceligenerans pegani]|uniref:SDR family oxidoreductase n=1 Tax=Myceligenerans pegani TaxID=2776917 RepID=UPI00299DE6AA|nr:SDR family oxidoreductase [Myceligenerans sp. TRM 65318]